MSHLVSHVMLSFLIITIIQFENAGAQSCQSGWFGSKCQYKCHCQTSTCDVEGMCADGICERHWFGPDCQYKDILSYYSTEQTPTWLIDDNSNTCNNDRASQQITVNLNTIMHFTWLRLQVQDPSLLKEFQITFLDSDKSSKAYTNMRRAIVNERAMDVHCDMNVSVQYVILTGKGVRSLCSLYVNQGRNVALRQIASQSSKLHSSLGAEKAVDGNTNSNFKQGNCAATKDGDKHPAFNITFSREQRLNRFVLYYPEDYKKQFRGFTITTFAKDLKTVMTYTDKVENIWKVYAVWSTHYEYPVSLVNIQASTTITSQPRLALCEFEIYGDSACPPSKYGRECQYTCNCAIKNESCFVSTGGCPSGCSAGFQ